MAERQARRRGSLAERALTAVLTSPPAMALKRSVRDLRWTLKADAPINPPWPTQVTSMLFVCLGNICRSPFAAVLAEQKVAAAGRPDIRCESAGIRTRQSGRSPEAACAAARRYGLSLDAHRPILLTRELVDRHDLIVVMEAQQLEELRRTYPDASDRIVLLSLFDAEAAQGYERYHIADPFMQPLDVFEACYRRIDRAVTALVDHLQNAPTGAGGTQ